MDLQKALQHGHKVGLTVVRDGHADPQTIKQNFVEWAGFTREGVQGTFAQLLVARKVVDETYGRELDARFPPDYLDADPASEAPAQGANPKAETRATARPPAAGDRLERANSLLDHLSSLTGTPAPAPLPQPTLPQPTLPQPTPLPGTTAPLQLPAGLEGATQRYDAKAILAEIAADPSPAPLVHMVDEVLDTSSALGWLECEPLPPLPVGIKDVTTLGRAPSCDMVLPHKGVSRVHAVVRTSGTRLILDDRSSYGTFVNAHKVRTHTLATGDVIAIGPYVLVVRADNPDATGEDTVPFRIPGLAVEGMHGRLLDVSLGEVLQQIEFNEKSGTLSLITDGARGTLVFYEGRPMWAEMGELKDQEAVFAMLETEEGEFSFVAKVEAGERTLETTVTGLLMDFSRRVDESG